MTDTILKYGFGESLLFLLPKLSENRYGLFTKEKDSFVSGIPGGIKTPLSGLQKRWLKAVLNDPRASLFLSPEQIDELRQLVDEEDLISRAGYTLSHAIVRDILLECCFKSKIFNVIEVNIILDQLDHKPLSRIPY